MNDTQQELIEKLVDLLELQSNLIVKLFEEYLKSLEVDQK